MNVGTVEFIFSASPIYDRFSENYLNLEVYQREIMRKMKAIDKLYNFVFQMVPTTFFMYNNF